MTVTANLITCIGLIVVRVSDQEQALEFYIGKLGFEKHTDVVFGPNGERWIEVAPAGATTHLAIVPPREGEPAGTATGISITTGDIDALHAEFVELGVDADEVSRMGGPVPPLFFFRDPEGNSLFAVQPA